MKPVSLYVALNHGSGFLSKVISWCQAPGLVIKGDGLSVATHARLGFVMEDGSEVFFEALEGRGVQGPIPEKSVSNWVYKSRSRWTSKHYIEIAAQDVEEIYQRCHLAVGAWSYSVPQLLGMYLNLRLKLPLFSTPNGVVCSEAVARWLYPAVNFSVNGDFERVTPYSIQKQLRQMALVARVTKINAYTIPPAKKKDSKQRNG